MTDAIRHTALRFALACLLAATTFSASADDPAPSWYDRAVQRVETTWAQGQTELYIPLHTYHVRSAYTDEKIASFNETPLGLGVGKGYYDQDGDWHGLYVMGFQDSHSKPEYIGGYAYKTYWPLAGDLKFGLGYTAFITTRADIGHYMPIPMVLPTAALEYGKFSFDTLYVPGGHGRGNIFFFWGKVRF